MNGFPHQALDPLNTFLFKYPYLSHNRESFVATLNLGIDPQGRLSRVFFHSQARYVVPPTPRCSSKTRAEFLRCCSSLSPSVHLPPSTDFVALPDRLDLRWGIRFWYIRKILFRLSLPFYRLLRHLCSDGDVSPPSQENSVALIDMVFFIQAYPCCPPGGLGNNCGLAKRRSSPKADNDILL